MQIWGWKEKQDIKKYEGQYQHDVNQFHLKREIGCETHLRVMSERCAFMSENPLLSCYQTFYRRFKGR